MAWRVDQVDQEVSVLLLLLLHEGVVGLGYLVEERDGRRLDGDAALLLVLARVGEAGLASLGRGDDARLAHERVGERRLAVVDVRNHGHVADVLLLVHERTDLVDGEVNLLFVCIRITLEMKCMSHDLPERTGCTSERLASEQV